jgi:dolichol-phosphate mannosyltransferase
VQEIHFAAAANRTTDLSLLGLRTTQRRIQSCAEPSADRICAILPVLNEAERIDRALDGLVAQPEELCEILVVDGGSSDGTAAIVQRYRARDRRVRWIDASPIDPQWTGKAWGLHCGLQQSPDGCRWILCVDADVSIGANLARSLLAHASKSGVSTFSVAAQQYLSGKLEALIHPSMLTTLVYRYGSPGKATRNPRRVQANGQCFFSRRESLMRAQAFHAARTSLCEDITIARRLAEEGEAVGFYEAEPGLVGARMYESWRDTWLNWPRSLPMRDRYFGWRQAAGLGTALALQALPLPLLLAGFAVGAPFGLQAVVGTLSAVRIAVLIGVARAYPDRPWTYWLSPACDLPVAIRIAQFALKRRHRWRGRTYRRRSGGRFEPLERQD